MLITAKYAVSHVYACTFVYTFAGGAVCMALDEGLDEVWMRSQSCLGLLGRVCVSSWATSGFPGYGKPWFPSGWENPEEKSAEKSAYTTARMHRRASPSTRACTTRFRAAAMGHAPSSASWRRWQLCMQM